MFSLKKRWETFKNRSGGVLVLFWEFNSMSDKTSEKITAEIVFKSWLNTYKRKLGKKKYKSWKEIITGKNLTKAIK